MEQVTRASRGESRETILRGKHGRRSPAELYHRSTTQFVLCSMDARAIVARMTEREVKAEPWTARERWRLAIGAVEQ